MSLKSRMVLTTAVLAVIGGYSRRAYANCTLVTGTYTCTGVLTTTQVLSGTPLTVATANPLSVITTSGDAFNLIGTNGLSFTDTFASTVITGETNGIYARNLGTGALSILVTGPVTGTGTGTNAAGIYARNDGIGALSITANGNVTGGRYGIYARNAFTGADLTISTAAGSIVTGGRSGIYALQYGTGALSITANGDVTGTSTDGIYAWNGSAATSMSITTGAGTIAGGRDGIFARNQGFGALSITANGDVTGTSTEGIYARNSAAATSMSIITGAGTIAGGKDGIFATENGTGDLLVTTGAGGSVTGGIYGIKAKNYGASALSITANGNVTGTSGYGIGAFNANLAGTDLSIMTGTGSAVTGGNYGIRAVANGAGALSVTANGNITGAGNTGIFAYNTVRSTGDLLITTGTDGTATGGSNGIWAKNFGSGDMSITASGSVAGGLHGIYANNASRAGLLNITTGGAVTGTSGYGIKALNAGSGPTTITVNAGSVVQGSVAGIFVDPVAPIAIANVGTIQNLSGASDALAIMTAGAPTAITNSGTITGTLALGDLGNSFTNSGTWNTVGGMNAFGALVASNSLTNQASGTIIAASAGSTSAQTTSFNNTGTFTNAGLLTLQNGFAGDKAIVQGNFVGNNGTVALDTVLGADNSVSDQLVLNGGHASGTTLLKIVYAGGGTQTTGKGIPVVLAQNGATTSADAFKLSGQVTAGAYQYTLFNSGNVATGGDPNDQGWYLRSTLQTPSPTGPQLPNYRTEVPVYLAMPELANTVGLAMIGTYDTRMGGDRDKVGAAFAPDQQPVIWGRLLGATGQQKPGNQTGLDTSNDFLNGKGPRYGYAYGGLQLGMDLWRKASNDGSHDHVGAYGGILHANADVDQVYDVAGTSNNAGSLNMDAYSLGAYWTHFGATGWYSDVVMQGTWFGNIKGQTANTTMSVQGSAFTGSAEAGYPFHFDGGWTIEPQGQIIFQHQSLDGGADLYGLTSFNDTSDVRGRIGAKLSQVMLIGEGADATPLTIWARANLWHDFAVGDPSATFANLSGANLVTLNGTLGDTWAQIEAGVSGHVTQSISLTGSVFYDHAIDGAQSWSAGGSGGIKSPGAKIGASLQF